MINNIPQDPTELVLQGEEMRAAAMGMPAIFSYFPFLSGSPEPFLITLIAGEQTYPPMASDMSVAQETMLSMVSDGSSICTPCGSIIPHDIGNHLMNGFTQSAQRFLISGVTRDSAGAALGTCRVMLWREINYISETVSDASGNYSFVPSGNQAHQITAYKSGAPDRAGISIQNVIPSANG